MVLDAIMLSDIREGVVQEKEVSGLSGRGSVVDKGIRADEFIMESA